MSPDRRSVLRAATALSALGLASSCARIPTDSPISQHEVDGRAQPGAPYVRALPPAPDADPEEVVAGFVQAGVGPEDDYAVAREYLTPAAREVWDPHAGVIVYSGTQELELEQVDDHEMVLTIQAVATVGADGVRNLLASPTVREIRVQLESVDEQWRIAEVADGIYLSEASFENLYAPARLYFVDAREQHLVPDHRWIPLQRGADAVLDALAGGPAEFLGEAVGSEVPADIAHGDTLVTTGTDGLVQVTVPAEVGTLPTGARALALAQIEASLRSLRTLSGVRLVWEGADLTPADQHPMERARPGHRPIAAGPTGVISLAAAADGAEASQQVPDLTDIEVSSPVIAQDTVLAAALTTGDSVVLITSTDGSVPLREAAAGGVFAPPRIDDAGYVWTSPRSNSGALLALSGSGPEQDAMVEAAWLAGREVQALDIAADGTRMIVLSLDGGGSRLDLCAVVRDADGVPSSLTEPLELRTFLTDVIQASWYDEIGVILLGEDPGTGDLRAQVVDFATGRDPLPPLSGEVNRVAGTAVADTIWAGRRDDTLLRSDGDSWVSIDLPGRDPSFY